MEKVKTAKAKTTSKSTKTKTTSASSKTKKSDVKKELAENKQPITIEEKFNEKEMYVVGIGASAGGVEALQIFFRSMPMDSGIAFVVVQHLSPDYKSYMSNLLSRCTDMTVMPVTNGMEIKPNTVYLNVPNCNLQIEGDHFVVQPIERTDALNLPIDILFRSMASSLGKFGIGIVLSGSGSDGSMGIRALKEEGGMIMAQSCLSAQFSSMPQSSIATGFVDYVLAPEEMGEELVRYIKHPYIKEHKLLHEVENNRETSDVFVKVISLLREYTDIDFSMYKETTVLRRIERRVSINRCESVNDYYAFLMESDEEKRILSKEMLIGVTSFFRDREAFASVEKNVLPKLDFSKGVLRVWSVACSTGEEVYSIAILLNEYMERNRINGDFKIFATDVEHTSIEIAGRGIYSENSMVDVPKDYLNKYFIRKGNNYQICDTIRNKIVFAMHDVLKDPAFSKLDLLLCRNLFIYLKPEMQQRILGTFYYALYPSGMLFMGSSESVGEMSEAFSIVDSKWKIYNLKKGYSLHSQGLIAPLMDSPIERKHLTATSLFSDKLSKKVQIDKVVEKAVSSLLPPSVLLDENDNIIHVISGINKYVDLKPGKFTNNLLAVVPNDLSLFISSILRRLRRGGEEYIQEKITGLHSYENEEIIISGARVEYNSIDYYLISFESHERTLNTNLESVIDADMLIGQRIEELEKELQASKESLHATVEELETSNEELQSTNEELIASNEELQSTNEELQSVNEELYTVNSEYQAKIDELTFMTEDLNNLLVNGEIGALYLDTKLCIRKITPIILAASNVVETDIGRPVSQIAFMKNYPQFLDDVEHVLHTCVNIHREIPDLKGKIWLIRIQPYRTELHPVDGVLLTMVDISSTIADTTKHD